MPGFDGETEALDPRLDHRGTANQNRARQLLFQHHLSGMQHALVLTLGVDDADRLGLGFREHRLHDQTGAEREPLELGGVVVEFLDRTRRNARLHRCSRHCRRDAQDKPRIEWARDQRPGPEALRLTHVETLRAGINWRVARQLRDRIDRSFLHLLVDRGSPDIERAAKDEWKAQDIVDLVWKIGAPGADHRIRTRFAGLVRHDFRIRIGQRHYQRLVRHLLHHVGRQHIGC